MKQRWTVTVKDYKTGKITRLHFTTTNQTMAEEILKLLVNRDSNNRAGVVIPRR